jgi:hypothetical protein
MERRLFPPEAVKSRKGSVRVAESRKLVELWMGGV